MRSDIETDLLSAVDDRAELALTYGDGDERIVHPHALFRSPAGQLLLASFQVDGYSSSGALPQWRNLTVSKITNLSRTGATFTVEKSFDLADARFSHDLIAYARP